MKDFQFIVTVKNCPVRKKQMADYIRRSVQRLKREVHPSNLIHHMSDRRFTVKHLPKCEAEKFRDLLNRNQRRIYNEQK